MYRDFFQYKDNFKLYSNVDSKLVIGDSERRKYKFTIAIPTYKRPDLLIKALESAINQDGEIDYEIVVVDNDPDTLIDEKILEYYGNKNLFYYKNDVNIGMFGNWNRCVELANGEYITLLNDDDYLSSDYLIKCEKNMGKDVDGLIFKFHTLYEQKMSSLEKKEKKVLLKNILYKISKKTKKLSLFDYFLGNKSAGTLGVLLKTKYLKELGGFNPDYFPSSDFVFHANYCYKYNLYLVNEKLNYYRFAENESARQETLQIWEYLDNEIRKYFISLIGKNETVLLMLNSLIQDLQVKALIDTWNYQTKTNINYKFKHRIFQIIVGLKYYLNI